MKRIAILFAVAATASGCTTTKAATPIERPALEVPPVPPRVVEPAPPPEVSNPEPVPPLSPEKTPPTAKPKPASRDNPSRDTQKPETAKPEPPATEPPPAAPPVTQPPPRTTGTPDAAAAERRIRDSLTRTEEMLKNIDYKRLRPERQIAYDQAKSHIEVADRELKASNLELAKEMADKAEKLARELQTR